jgi:hypothetical protein
MYQGLTALVWMGKKRDSDRGMKMEEKKPPLSSCLTMAAPITEDKNFIFVVVSI